MHMLAPIEVAAEEHGISQVFTTCGSAGKRTFLQQTFPWLDDAHIGDSRSISFEGTVLEQVSLDTIGSLARHCEGVWRNMM